MTVGLTLWRYFAIRFLIAILGLFLFAAVLIFIFDFLELVRRGGDREGFTVLRVALISLLRIPVLLEQVLPFATLFGAILAFVTLSRSLELVIARASGMSVWQFIAPALIVAIFLGALAIVAYNPLAVALKDKSDQLSVDLFGNQEKVLLQASNNAWLRQDGLDGETILHASQSTDQGLHLYGVTIFAFDKKGIFRERVEAKEATLGDGAWHLKDAIVYTADDDPKTYASYLVSTYLGPLEVRQSIASPESVSFWDLPSLIELARRAGLPAYRYTLQYETLFARPLLLAAMVLIAAAVSLRVSRFGGLGRMILGGISAGFVLYVLTELAKDLGGAGIVSPVVAAWSPGIVATLMGFTILLHQEDG
ncbi:lipopolysaccharide export system permease protein [Breoghania corrubedonensis]|uniref:Lipopolysaccharide export system permease protein n=1 Tax=Breoghania corrubedonensis TaxID=665038 RepID=A0A2T5V9K2_9HYPH|nr:LPS export ABC transporter permease LptG [Breoghania corrubedonensis]PTW60435.1 lipopolysaccharide export system permease protein [Breoghania corrubedonensis]